MGMFDYVYCEYPLPESWAQDLVFQTKDTEPEIFVKYRIDKDGDLYREIYDTPEDSFEETNKRWVRDLYHGFINFYTDSRNCPTHDHCWIKFRAKFNDGKLASLETDEHRCYSE